ncbi:hypothetical protein M404DRAFT_26425 [Pisolithus tinctorius Marx 270]|uniref:BHLH domain-containing protein n=1 Tax=Pisolithus tinctorius Marx 270 TaxID=870435 RepID=A0A0C3J567_PISTI|nr:hypothetical protein M404DRAFT_26425 [Pisolithus tinctorius Marx 270]
MALTLTASPSSDDRSSPASDDGSAPPHTPNSPNNTQTLYSGLQNLSNITTSIDTSNTNRNSETALTAAQPQATAPPKKKPSRRANTAERRATHNAVERARRETLNSRFLDLAALLPNLTQIRRPSKSAIVNSSIAHVHAARRHRLLASRELRILKSESDALRRELNEWRDRAGLPRVEEPIRSEGFGIVLSGEIEIIPLSGPGAPGSGIDEDDSPFDGLDEADEDLGAQPTAPMDDIDDVMSGNAAAIIKSAAAVGANPGFANVGGNVSDGGMLQSHVMSRGSGPGPIIAQMPPPASFENPVMPATYEPQAFGGQFFTGQHHLQQSLDNDKVPAWTTTFANTTTAFHQQMQQHPMISHPAHTPSSAADHAQIFENSKRQHQQLLAMRQHQQSQRQLSFPAVDADDTTSVVSSRSGSERDMGDMRARSASTSTGYGSPPGHGSSSSPVLYDSSGNYESPVRYDRMGMVPQGDGWGIRWEYDVKREDCLIFLVFFGSLWSAWTTWTGIVLPLTRLAQLRLSPYTALSHSFVFFLEAAVYTSPLPLPSPDFSSVPPHPRCISRLIYALPDSCCVPAMLVPFVDN